MMQLDYNLEAAEEVYLINTEAAKLAKQCTKEYMEKHPGERKFVAGAIGPTNKTLSVSPSVENPAFRGITYEEVEEAYFEQIKGLYDGGVDLFLVETIFDTLNAKAAVYALERFFEEKQLRIPVFLSGTIVDNSGNRYFENAEVCVTCLRQCHQIRLKVLGALKLVSCTVLPHSPQKPPCYRQIAARSQHCCVILLN